MDFKQLRYFCVIAQEKSITKAAEKCYIAQPSLSQSIANLEKELGVKLLDRASRGHFADPSGGSFLPVCHRRTAGRKADPAKTIGHR